MKELYTIIKKISCVATQPSKQYLECLNQKKFVIKCKMLTDQCCAR